MKPHPHAKIAQQYWKEAETDDEAWKNWEIKMRYGWIPCQSPLGFYPENQYRRRPRTIRIGEYDIPEPLREAPEMGARYWFPAILSDTPVGGYTWDGTSTDRALLQRGMIHITEEAARIHAEAIISLTKK
jgi:hypothetical protein